MVQYFCFKNLKERTNASFFFLFRRSTRKRCWLTRVLDSSSCHSHRVIAGDLSRERTGIRFRPLFSACRSPSPSADPLLRSSFTLFCLRTTPRNPLLVPASQSDLVVFLGSRMESCDFQKKNVWLNCFFFNAFYCYWSWFVDNFLSLALIHAYFTLVSERTQAKDHANLYLSLLQQLCNALFEITRHYQSPENEFLPLYPRHLKILMRTLLPAFVAEPEDLVDTALQYGR